MLDKLVYDESSFSCLRWKEGQLQGVEAGSRRYRKNGKAKTITIQFGLKRFRAHRIIWEMFNGSIPDGLVVDHIDRNPFNNKLSNLRLVSVAQNNRNRSRPSTNKSGVTGVYSYTTKGRKIYVARWSEDGKDVEKHFLVCSVRTDAEAFLAACLYREEMIQRLNQWGADYSETHGL